MLCLRLCVFLPCGYVIVLVVVLHVGREVGGYAVVVCNVPGVALHVWPQADPHHAGWQAAPGEAHRIVNINSVLTVHDNATTLLLVSELCCSMSFNQLKSQRRVPKIKPSLFTVGSLVKTPTVLLPKQELVPRQVEGLVGVHHVVCRRLAAAVEAVVAAATQGRRIVLVLMPARRPPAAPAGGAGTAPAAAAARRRQEHVGPGLAHLAH